MTTTVASDRFGTIDANPDDIIEFPSGIIGFPNERQFILVRHGRSDAVAWLQSTQTAALAFPVVSAHGFRGTYPDVPVEEVASANGIGSSVEELAVMAVLSAPPSGPATVNLMAPILVNAAERKGVQVFLEGTRFSTRELYFLPRERECETEPAPPLADDDAEMQMGAE
ncbi:MAG: flagellar assembly protein FliW [Polyangiaceae bacterium]|nr:flagellar assembly protein FliW [Polyangiaceae bacterium]